MINIALQPIIDALAALDIVDKVAGLVMPATASVPNPAGQGRLNVTFPVACNTNIDQCVQKGRYMDLLPGSAYASVLYFEQTGNMTFEGFPEAHRGRVSPTSERMIYAAPVRLVGWLNAKKLGYDDCSVTGWYVLTIIQTLLAQRGYLSQDYGYFELTDPNITGGTVEVEIVDQATRSASIFSAYTFQANSLWPFDYFAIDMNVRLIAEKRCVVPITVQAELC